MHLTKISHYIAKSEPMGKSIFQHLRQANNEFGKSFDIFITTDASSNIRIANTADILAIYLSRILQYDSTASPIFAPVLGRPRLLAGRLRLPREKQI